MRYLLSRTVVRVTVTLAVVAGFAAAAQNAQGPEKRITPAEVQWPAAAGAATGTSGVTGIQTVVLKGDPAKGGPSDTVYADPRNDPAKQQK
ncbi:MAG TPA: hypothetical protein VE422_38890 [Terriglobia bacterium]|nr:hypothetical protein [Terriglobia bacterium]